jgi:hypothetical protein
MSSPNESKLPDDDEAVDLAIAAFVRATYYENTGSPDAWLMAVPMDDKGYAHLRPPMRAALATIQSERPLCDFIYGGPEHLESWPCDKPENDPVHNTASAGIGRRHEFRPRRTIQAQGHVEITSAKVRRACESVNGSHERDGARPDEDTSNWGCCRSMRDALEAAING